MKHLFLALAIIGALIPMAFFLNFFSDPGGVNFVEALFVNGAAGGFSADLLISSFVFWAYMWMSRAEGPAPWLFIALNLGIGLSCALPAYIYVRLSRQTSSDGEQGAT